MGQFLNEYIKKGKSETKKVYSLFSLSKTKRERAVTIDFLRDQNNDLNQSIIKKNRIIKILAEELKTGEHPCPPTKACVPCSPITCSACWIAWAEEKANA